MKIKAATILSIFMLMMPYVVSAQTYSTSAEVRSALLIQIERLVAEVSRLQSILNSRSNTSTQVQFSNYTPYQTVLFPLSFESKYLVEDNRLVTISSQTNTVRDIDKQIFTLFSDVVGREAISGYVQEFRIFSNEGDLGAFVENINGGNKWVVGVNRAGFDSLDQESNEIFTDLFIHEYAHILMSISTDFAYEFKNSFWTASDIEHSETVNKLSSMSKFYSLNKYYERNTNRFVSDYATMNYEEDVAESFVSFVYGGVPSGSSVKDKKILSFYKDSIFIDARDKLRSNLLSLNLLK